MGSEAPSTPASFCLTLAPGVHTDRGSISKKLIFSVVTNLSHGVISFLNVLKIASINHLITQFEKNFSIQCEILNNIQFSVRLVYHILSYEEITRNDQKVYRKWHYYPPLAISRKWHYSSVICYLPKITLIPLSLNPYERDHIRPPTKILIFWPK